MNDLQTYRVQPLLGEQVGLLILVCSDHEPLAVFLPLTLPLV
jgi:hypothetical protein